MNGTVLEEIKYYGVFKAKVGTKKEDRWEAKIRRGSDRLRKQYPFTPEGQHKAAIAIDTFLIKRGSKPVNILKPKV